VAVSYEERGVWIYLGVAVVTFGTYVALIVGRAGTTPLADVDYVSTLLWVVGASVVATIVVRVLFEIVRPGESGYRSDPRDREIIRFGDNVGGMVLGAAVAGVLVLALVEADHFWIANAIYAAFIAQAISSSVVKLVAYRRGL
jgi:hypothetical protein